MSAADPGLVAGFDAGQTHTTCRLVRPSLDRPPEEWPVLAEAEGPGVCHIAAPGGEERFLRALRRSLRQALSALGPEPAELEAAGVGASGIEQGTPVQERGRALAAEALALPSGRVVVTGDERTALRGAFGAEAGILVISGTGTIAVGQNGQGHQHRCGGWGWLLDGAGSAHDIGRDGLALTLQMADGRLPDGPLRQRLWAGLGLDPSDPLAPQRIKALVVAAGFGPADFARLAPLVEEEARRGDAGATRILERSARALAELVAGVAARLELEEVAVVGSGGALHHLEELRRRFQGALAERLPGAALTEPRGDACAGAVALAAKCLRRR
ncbi:MAG: BadF/BadG/BcrA/BcrD ATPase family protein [Synechococcus sp.]|nr:BadF/BadG/BcrA/BcrD ATPase family protein [Synechococcus sp.]